MTPTQDDFRIELIGHASFRVRCNGRTLVTDPWWIGPLAPNSANHFPPLVHDIATLAAETDFLYISHIHPDHFHLPTLRLLRKNIPVYIGAHRRKEFRDTIAALGFPVIECPFQELVPVVGSDFSLALIEHDYEENAAYDSSVVIRTANFNVFNNNDCVLRAEKYAWVRRSFRIDYAFLGYSPASFYPICFDMDADTKRRLLAASAQRRYEDFVDAARRIRPSMAIPFASGARFLQDGERWKNVAFNSAAEAVSRAQACGIRAEVMQPGDRITADDRVQRGARVLGADEELAAIDAYALRNADAISARRATDPPVRSDLVARFADYIHNRWKQVHKQLPGLSAYTIAYEVGGEQFHFDFSLPEGEFFAPGLPPRYDMLYRYPPAGLQRKLDGEIDWDDLHFSSGISVHQTRYAREFVALLRSEILDLG